MVEGKAKLYMTHKNGKVSLIDYLEAPLFMGEIELLNEARYTKGIQTVATTICYSIRQSCKEKLLADALFLRRLCLFLGEKATNMTAKYTQNQAYPLENRLVSFFIQLSAEQGIYKEKHTEICEYLGVSYRHLLYVLAQFCEERILEKRKAGYYIIDEKRLSQLAQDIQ